MNKKIIVLILFIFLLLSVVVISLFGAQPAPPTPRVEKIEFVDESGVPIEKMEFNITDYEENEDGKIIVTFKLNYIVNPSTAVDPRVKIEIYDDGSNNKIKEMVNISEDGYVTITLENKIGLNIPVVATCFDKSANFFGKTAKIDIVITTKTGSDSDIIL